MYKDEIGFCKTRINKDGVIGSFIHGLIPALSYNPIEKKPFFHFYPGSVAITIGTYGCNFNCFWCQNHNISHPNGDIGELINNAREFLPPEKVIELAIKNNCQGTSISFNEPTLLFEYSLEVFKFAKLKGFYNTYVSNGYMTEEVLRDLAHNGLDAMNIDIKGNYEMVRKFCGTDIEIVWRNAKLAKDLGIHIELTTLLIENYNTDESVIKEICENIVTKLGKSTPFHLTRAFPQYKSSEYGFISPTPISSLIKAYNIAKSIGLDFVYLGNLPSSNYENTYCPTCKALLIKRLDYEITKIGLTSKGKCKKCDCQIINYM
ncbi:MAG: AmmeMemoRadiSam system radical SAM enzyme [Candidatus Lokiarchaeota archaeon]|nr:AmmeMemoRadiSam system radical SAM enzyme [Candidatus Lokiarchaeota archaeon]